MRILPAIALLAGLVTFSSIAVGTTPTFSQSKLVPAGPCKQLTDFPESPIQLLPKPFEQGCAFFTPLRANNPGTIVYVLKAATKLPVKASSTGEVTVQQAETLNRLVERGQAVRITWFAPGTIGSQQFVQSLPEETVFVAWNDLCTKFQPRKVGCVESGAFRPGALAEILVRNKERAAKP